MINNDIYRLWMRSQVLIDCSNGASDYGNKRLGPSNTCAGCKRTM